MRKRTSFRFEPALWLNNRALRGCSPDARGFWVDLLCLCFPSGHLTINGKPVADAQIARMIGEPIKKVREWLRELGEAGIYSVSDAGILYSSRMVKEEAFSAQSKMHGSKGGKKAHAKKKVIDGYAYEVPTGNSAEDKKIKAVLDLMANPPQEPAPAVDIPASVSKPKKALAWWATPAGWVRHGASQAISIGADESIEEFQVRLSARIPPGAHLQSLTDQQQKMVEIMRPKEPGK